MRVIAIGTDRKLFEPDTAVRVRQQAYAERLGHLDSIVFTKSGYTSVNLDRLAILPTNSYSKIAYGFDAWRIARRLERPDIVTTQDPFETGLIALCVARLLRVPLHVQVHTDFTARAFRRHSFINWLRVQIAWFVLRSATRVRVILERTGEDLKRAGIKAPITVLPIFVDVERLSSISRNKHPRWKIALLCIGRFEKEKRFELAIDALIAARRAGHDVGLTLVGDGSLRDRYYRYAQRYRVADRLEILGWQNDLTKLYAEADLVLVPSRYEGYGLVIVEALAAGIPVLSTDVGVAREAGAMVVGAREFADTLLRWLSDGPRRGDLAIVPYKDFDEYVERYCEDIERSGQ
jgi:glycosyltransferase involved in cell wall biosynthesis